MKVKMTKIVNFFVVREKRAKKRREISVFWGNQEYNHRVRIYQKMVVLRSSPNEMKQNLKFSNFYIKPNLRNNSIKTVNFEILMSRDIEILSVEVKKNVK